MKFSKLAVFLSRLEETASRNEMTRILADLYKKAEVSEIDKICYLSLGRLAPLYEVIEFNLAEKLMFRVLVQAYNQPEEGVRKKFKELGDLGNAAAFYDKKPARRSLSVSQVYERLYEIAGDFGKGSVERKITKTSQLLADSDSLSVKYIVRIPLGKLRLGFSDKTILDALSWMITGDKSKRKEIEMAYQVRADVGQIAKIIKEKGIKGLRGITVSVGTPVIPALCQRLPTAEEMVKKMGKVAAEPKYDGTRLQIHLDKKRVWEKKEGQTAFDFQPAGFVRTFTRNLENTTYMFPDLVQAIFKEIKGQTAILDCEVVSYDPKTGRLLPFQETMKRKRKHEVTKTAQEIPLRFYCFDVLYKDGQDLIRQPFSKRRRILEKMISPIGKTVFLSPQITTEDPQELRRFHDQQIKEGLEGIVVKKWQAVYDLGRRGYAWVKFKQEKGKRGGGLADTIDCVVMGYFTGEGKRTGFGIGKILVGIRKSETSEEFMTLTKVGTGLSDIGWREMRQRCDKLKARDKPKQYQVEKGLIPDVWCLPEIVVVIEADNITKSPVHLTKYSLRFPRWLRFREDKSPQEITTLEEVKKLYDLQK